MEPIDNSSWRWTRGILAVVLAMLLLGIALPGTGRIVVDQSTLPPTHHIIRGVRDWLPVVGTALFSLTFIFVGMWKRWDVEIVGWALLLVYIVASGLGSPG